MQNTNFFAEETNTDATPVEEGTVIPVIEETVTIEKAVAETATVKVSKTVTQTPQQVNVSLLSEEYSIEHVALDLYVDGDAPKARQEGNVWIVPVLKEVLVKRLLLVEEVRITKSTVERTEEHNAILRKEEVQVVRVPTEPGAGSRTKEGLRNHI